MVCRCLSVKPWSVGLENDGFIRSREEKPRETFREVILGKQVFGKGLVYEERGDGRDQAPEQIEPCSSPS